MDQLQAEEDVTILKQRIYSKRLPQSFNILDHAIDNIEQMLTRPILDQDKRVTLSSRRLKTIAQFKYDMMKLTITTAEEIVRSHTKIVLDEQKKLSDSSGNDQNPLSRSSMQQMNIIEARRNNMLIRSQHIIKKKMSFFDDAPTTTDKAGVAGAMI